MPDANRTPAHSSAPAADESRDALLATAMEAARAAAEIHSQALRDGGHRRTASKSWGNDFVTDVDLAAQEAALAVIGARHPHHAILAEEDEGTEPAGDARRTPAESGSRHLWIVDPLDGTTNFMHGHSFHAASVAVYDSQGPLAATVHAPALERIWTATRGGGARENERPIQVSRVRALSGFLVGTGFPFKIPRHMDRYLRQLEAVLRATSGVRRTGAAAIDLAYLASGILDGFWELQLAPWDFAAGALLVAEAGGVAECIEGGPLGVAAGSVLAANSHEGVAGLRGLLG